MTGTRKHYNDGFEGPPLEAGITWFDPASAGSPEGQDTVGGLIGEADDIAVGRQADAPNTLSTCNSTTIGERQAIAEIVREIYVRWSDDGQHIRKWDFKPFDGGTCFLATPTTNAPVADLEQVHRIIREACDHCGVKQPTGYQLSGPFDDNSDPWQVAVRAVSQALALRQTLPIHGEMREALERIDQFVTNFRQPWGSWKTVWWEGEVSDEAAFSADNALMHVANIARNALQGDGL